DTVLHVRADACADGEAEVGCDDDGGAGLQSELELQAAPGVTYLVAVDAFRVGGAWTLVAQPGPCGGVPPACVLDVDCQAGEICQDGACVPEPVPDCVVDADCAADEICQAGACVPAPADACGAAEAVDLPLRVRGTTAGANDFQGACGGRGPEAVYTFTAAADGVACADTTGSGYDTLLYVRRAACADGAQVACNDDAVGLRARVEFAVTAGEDYFVFVDGFNGGGDYVLSLFNGPCAQAPECFVDADCPLGQACGPDATCEPGPPPACVDDGDCAAGQSCQAGECRPQAGGLCDLPTLIEGEGVFEGTTAGAPATVGAACGGGAGSSEVVFEFAPAAAGDWCFTTTGSLYDTVLHVRTPDCDGEAVACNDDSPLAGGLQSALTLPVQADATYFVFVDGFGANSAGPFTLNVSRGACQ
ncbi:MAG: hypothetical protein KC613_12795, partial [Myxococcales bacterium]|nr:hypothetical protein [Myxococcales bacterium]